MSDHPAVTHVEHAAHGKHGSGLFSRKIGPFSAGAWLGIVVGGVALGIYAKKRGPLAGPPSTGADPAADPAATPADPGGLSSSGLANGYGEPAVIPVAVTVTTVGAAPVTPTSTPGAVRPPTVPAAPRRPSSPPQTPTHTMGGRTFTVHGGDTLSALGARYGVDWHQLYTANASTIEAAARAHGKASSDSGHWIYPGTVLRLP